MTKQRDDIQDLKRRLSLLDKLDGGAIVCADGVFSVKPGRVRDPRPIVKACEVGRPTSAALAAAMGGVERVAIDRALLAAAHRDLRAIEAAPALRALAGEAPRIFRRYGDLDDAWFSHKRARLAILAELVRAAEAGEQEARPSHAAAPPWFSRVLDVIRLVYGDGAARAVEGAIERLAEARRAERREAARAIEELVAGLEGRREATSRAVIAASRAIAEAQRLSGRSRARRVAAIVREMLGVKAAPEEHTRGDARASLAAQVRAAGEEARAALDPPSSPESRERTYQFFAAYALAFDPTPRDGGALSVRPAQIELGSAKLRDAIDRLGGRAITMEEALAILALGAKSHVERGVVKLVEAGLPIAKIERLASLDLVEHLVELDGDAKAAHGYADWALALGPHYASLGLTVPITPAMFAAFRGTRREDLGLLAVCLMRHHGRAQAGAAEEAIARLDATLGLFRRRPAEASAVLAELGATSPGAGRAAFPELAAWLGDDALLDRAVHLMRLAEQPIAISHTLRADFERRAAQERERAHLASLASPSPEQRARLSRIERGEVEIPDPSRTRRRLEERVRELSALAYEARVALVFRRIVKEVWGISLAKLTPAWHDAIRFSFCVDDNRELLERVLRAAAEGLDLDRALPANRAWIAEVSGRFDVERWLAPRARDVVIGGATMRIEIERDPVEVLRMGIPFGTCLALETGCNAASTVVNAADANKRVIYLRDRARKIIARKLIAVSDKHELLGYHLYVAAKEHKAAIEAAFSAFCGEIAADARLPLADAGEPKRIHAGFWYDDGTVAFGRAETAPSPAVEAYCRSLGRPAPPVVPRELEREAAVFDALDRGDLARIEALFADQRAVTDVDRRAIERLIAGKTRDEIAALARRVDAVGAIALEVAFERSAMEMIELAGALDGYEVAEVVTRRLKAATPTIGLANAIVTAAFAHKRAFPSFDDHGFEHGTMHVLPRICGALPIAGALAICDRVEPLWAWIEGEGPGCRPCREIAESSTIEAMEASYARRRDPAAVIATLESARSSSLARRAALRIAATYALAEDAPLPALPRPCLQRVRPCPAAMRALARLRQRAPELEGEPDLFAALLRQSAGSLPHGVALPVPREAPFEALGDLLVQLDLGGVLGPWLAVRGVASAWKPSRWELYYHRRSDTARRAALAEEARREPRASRATDWLAMLGDVRALEPLAAAEAPPPRRSRGAKAPKPEPAPTLSTLARALDFARNVAMQIDAADAIELGAMPLVAIELPLGSWKGGAIAVDPGLLVAAFVSVARHLEGAPMSADRAFEAFAVVRMGGAPISALERVVATLAARPSLSDEESYFVERCLREHPHIFGAEHGPDLAISIARHEPLRSTLFGAIASVWRYEQGVGLRQLSEAAVGARAPELSSMMFEGLLRAIRALGPSAIAELECPATFRRAVALALAEDRVESALRIFQESTCHSRAAVFVDELVRSRHAKTPALRAAVRGLRSWGESPELAAKYAWLSSARADGVNRDQGSLDGRAAR